MGGQALGIGRLWEGALLVPIGLSVIAATLLVFRRQRALGWSALVLALPVVAAAGDLEVSALGGSSLHAPFFCLAAAGLTLQVIRSQRADEDTVVGSICAYLFIAFAFAAV